jgi:hypothetical protein
MVATEQEIVMSAIHGQAHAAESDARIWAAEELALDLGWLRECPYHGEPFKVRGAAERASVQRRRRGVQSAGDDLMAYALRLTRGYGDECALCARENALPV